MEMTFLSGPKSLDAIRYLVLTFLKDELEKSANPFTCPLLFFPPALQQTLLFLIYPITTLAPPSAPLPPDLTSLKAILSVPEL